jgi:hypothetical protein
MVQSLLVAEKLEKQNQKSVVTFIEKLAIRTPYFKFFV